MRWPWDWRVTVLKAIKMTLIRSHMTDFQTTVGDDCVLARSPLPKPMKESSCPLIISGGSAFGHQTTLCLPTAQLFASEVDFPFQRLCLFTGCWAGSSQTLFSVTLMMCQGLLSGSVVRIHPPMQETQVRSLIWEDLLSYAVDQLSPRATAREPVLWSPWAPADDNPGACSLPSATREARPPQLGSSPTRESLHSSRGLAQPK